MEPIEGSETSAYIYQTPGNYPKENLLYIYMYIYIYIYMYHIHLEELILVI
jgi:hypothetical protein